MKKRYRANMQSGIIHDMENPCWWATNTNPSAMVDFFHIEEARDELKTKHFQPHTCKHCAKINSNIKK